MELEDFCENFNDLFICCENPNFIDGDLTCQWQCMTYDGSWVAGRSAGGNASYREPNYFTFNYNCKDKMFFFLSWMQRQKPPHCLWSVTWQCCFSCFSSPVASFETNPQYRIQVTKIDRDEKEDKNVLLSLMQKPQQQHRKGQTSYPIAVTVYKVCILTSASLDIK